MKTLLGAVLFFFSMCVILISMVLNCKLLFVFSAVVLLFMVVLAAFFPESLED